MNPMRTATIGIVIIATIMLLVFWFWVALALAGWLNPPRGVDAFGMPVTGDYISQGRIWFGIIFSVILSVATWVAGEKLAD